ncbi:hypothetical protein [Nonomuraea roseoviolacea]|uniref:XRE family transcriptional regulator n=1 Tax=Nonomuraea roseoviolacea subsp. carminata TaxID=160689 RepID=A0ABT1KAP2_9ACTN|nr:hypothetical protein [Nonomuraea roseoviolacea]MCP2350679.1 hypothetical protein [Nonomuraea roseoviolacea subsp. carminata]
MAHNVKLRRDEFADQAAALGLDSQSAQARAIGVHVSIHNRVITGKTKDLSGPYVIGILRLLGDDTVREQIAALFDVDEQVAS